MHSLLKRQIRRYLGDVDVSAEPLATFLAAVDRSYEEGDADRNLVESAMEISSQELLQANVELRGLVQAFPDLVLHVDADGVITAQRGSAVRAFGWERGALVGQPLRNLLSPTEAATFDDVLAATRTTGVVGTVVHARQEAGESLVHEMRLASLEAGAVIAIVRDLTDARRAADMQVAKEAAEAASRAKSAFLATMSHELRTPLTAILGYTEILAEEAEPDARQSLDRIEEAGQRLLQIVDTILEIASLEAGHTHISADVVDVASVVADVLATVRTRANEKHLVLAGTVADEAATITTDRVRLRKVLEIMLDNAVKFTRAGTVSLDVRASEDEAGTGLTFVVRDTGIGIPADKLAHIFGDFSQVDESDTRRFGGAGLGLSISWRICKLLGGRIDVTSQAGVGTTFSIALPCLAGRAASTTPAMARP